jgi:hypothetical protein
MYSRHMDTKKILAVGILGMALLIVVIFGILALFHLHSSNLNTATTTPATTFPVATTTSGVGASSTIMTIQGQSGTVLATKNFINNGTTIKDVENPGTYLLAGSLGYCLPDAPCTAGTSTEFNIFYDSTANAFTIGLLQEPLGAVRHHAEVYLESTLGLSKTDICALNYYVGTTYTVNEKYDAGNLGFSSCAGAVVLP